MSNDEAQPYQVGYRKPPRTTQFKKGQSGNLKGRPKGSKSFMALLADALNNEMDDNETLSITAWEKTSKGKVAMAACDKKSGWDKK